MDERADGAESGAMRVHAVPEAPEQIVRVVDLHKRYQLGRDNFVDALRGASVTVDRAEMAAIMGPSGSGKSTLMHIAGCLDDPDSGEVWLAGKRVDEYRGKELAHLRGHDIGFIFQGFNLIPTLNALDNVALQAEYAGVRRAEALRRAEDVLEVVGLSDRLRHAPSELSGGQQQRVAIARALVNDPAIVMGDEPTGDLDTGTSAEIVETMRRINRERGTTFLIVTHNPEVAEACDRIIRMRDGWVIDDGLGGSAEDAVRPI